MSPELRPLVRDALEAVAAAANDGERDEIERTVEKLLPHLPAVSPHAAEEAERQARLRTRILRDFGAWTAAEIADLAKSSARNRSARAGRWRAEGRIFGVPYRGVCFYLAFQFDEGGKPRPAIAEVIDAFGTADPWQLATWFVLANPRLDRRLPVDVLATEPAAVGRAARADALGGRGVTG